MERCYFISLALLSVSSPATQKQIGPFRYWFPGRWACVHSRTLWTPPIDSPVRLAVSPTTAIPMGFIARGFGALYFWHWNPVVAWYVLLLSCSYQYILSGMWDHPVHQPSPCHAASLPLMLISAPLTSLDECLFFNSLVVRFPYSLIFWKFWLLLVLKLVVFLLLIVQGSKTYLPILARAI